MWKLIRENLYFFIPFLVFLFVGGIALSYYSKSDLFFLINGLNYRLSDQFFKYYTNVGDGLFCVAIILLLLFYKFRYAIIGAGCFILTSLISVFVKKLIFPGILRPSAFFETGTLHPHVIEGVKLYAHNSFPSGHTITAFSIFCFLSIILRNKIIGLIFFLLAFLVAWSRIYLGQHFFIDTYFGSILGVVPTVILYFYLSKYFENSGKLWQEQNLRTRFSGNK